MGQEILARISERMGAHTPCEMCGTDDWDIPNQLVSIPTAGLLANKTVYRTFNNSSILKAMMICKHCGNTKLINLEAIGLFQAASQPA